MSSQSPAIGDRASSARLALTADLDRQIDDVVGRALDEDLGGGDVTAAATVPDQLRKTARVVLKEPAVLAGLSIMERVFLAVDCHATFQPHASDGDLIEHCPAVVASVTGRARALLSGERTALNLLQRLSGIATLTYNFVMKAQRAGIAILDTRKTTPGLRALERYAVRAGGGVNHRNGLYDRILIKDNHLRLAGGVAEAVRRARQARPGEAVEVEAASLAEVEEAIVAGAEMIMLDNMDPDTIKQAVSLIEGRSFIEVSGGIKLHNLEDYLIPGVDAISVGALTHSVRSIDISLEFED